MTALVELAAAKVNLSLRVCAKRSDGYHELLSIVAFATLADRLSMEPDTSARVEISGPFAHGIVGANLASSALIAASSRSSALKVGRIGIEKLIPVAGGLGGGSADAAAVLRLLDRANPGVMSPEDLAEIALGIGSDVPVCLGGRVALMAGRGEVVTPLARLPRLAAVLVNAGGPVPAAKTRAVFQALVLRSNGAEDAPARIREELSSVASPADFIARLRHWPNDLEPAATRIMPEIGEVMALLAAMPRVVLARLSGAGPTCFGLCADGAAASSVAAEIARLRPAWWVEAVELGDAPHTHPGKRHGRS